MRASNLEINKQKKEEFRRVLRDMKRLNIRVVSSSGKVVTNVQEIVQIAKALSEGSEQRKSSKEGAGKLHKGTQETRVSRESQQVEKQQSRTGANVSWHFSNHVFPGVETKTFSREEIYEDAEWEKNLH